MAPFLVRPVHVKPPREARRRAAALRGLPRAAGPPLRPSPPPPRASSADGRAEACFLRPKGSRGWAGPGRARRRQWRAAAARGAECAPSEVPGCFLMENLPLLGMPLIMSLIRAPSLPSGAFPGFPGARKAGASTATGRPGAGGGGAGDARPGCSFATAVAGGVSDLAGAGAGCARFPARAARRASAAFSCRRRCVQSVRGEGRDVSS